MISLMLQICVPIFGSCKYFVLGSGFFFAKGITELKSNGVYAAALIKKWCYWTKGIPGGLLDT